MNPETTQTPAPGDWNALLAALNAGATVQIGLALPDYAAAQAERGEPLHLERGRHQITAHRHGTVVGVDGDLVQLDDGARMTAAFYAAYCTSTTAAADTPAPADVPPGDDADPKADRKRKDTSDAEAVPAE